MPPHSIYSALVCIHFASATGINNIHLFNQIFAPPIITILLSASVRHSVLRVNKDTKPNAKMIKLLKTANIFLLVLAGLSIMGYVSTIFFFLYYLLHIHKGQKNLIQE